jgi:hypothetical protein
MKKAIKGITLRSVIITIVLILFLVFVFPFIHSIAEIYFKSIDMDDVIYDNSFVIGNTYENIVEKYGEFDEQWGNFGDYDTECCYMVEENYLNGLPLYYYVVFNSEKIAVKTFLAGPKGG